MSIKPFIENIERDVEDIKSTDFDYTGSTGVPNSNDPNLTYERDVSKKGKKFETCILFTDIRNSVALTRKHYTKTMGRIYTVFAKSVLKAASQHGGEVRNIIGDRVMVVFPPENCFKNAIDCAVTINHVSKYIINKKFDVDFKCGIGIDYGELSVIKVGIEKKGNENQDHKNLVWVGYPANYASRLTDVANKEIDKEYYVVRWYPTNPNAQKFPNIFELLSRAAAPHIHYYDPNAPFYSLIPETKEMTLEQFAQSIYKSSNGKLDIYGGDLISFERETRKLNYEPILITDSVFKPFKKNNPDRNSIRNNWWKEQSGNFDNMNKKVYGADLNWKI